MRIAIATFVALSLAPSAVPAQQFFPRPAREPDIKIHCVSDQVQRPETFVVWQREATCGALGAPEAWRCTITEATIEFSHHDKSGRLAYTILIDRVQGTMVNRSGASLTKWTCKPITSGTKKF